MKLLFHNKRISGMLVVIPERERSFVDDMKGFDFPEARSRKLMEVMGYDKHRLVEGEVCVSDLAVFGLQRLFDQGLLAPQDVDGLVLVTQSPDYFMPPTSNVIQGVLGLRHDIMCLDINQGCAGFIVGLIQAFMMLEQESIRKVVLLNADVLSRKTSMQDRNSYPLIGDACSITVIERDQAGVEIHAELKMDGARREALMIPAGGFRLPSSSVTALLEDVGDGNLRAKDHLRMEGSAVFNFVQTEVPELVASLLDECGVGPIEIDSFLFHQPNRFMLEKLANKMGLPYDKMPMNVVERFGNASGVTIPTAIAANLADRVTKESLLVCLAGFGVGLTWGAIVMPLGGLGFCDIASYPSGGH